MSQPRQSPLGVIGIVTVATRGVDGPGEVEVQIRGGTECFTAYSEQPVPRGRRVVCVDDLGGRAVLVEPWGE